jgi:hypothetical protein
LILFEHRQHIDIAVILVVVEISIIQVNAVRGIVLSGTPPIAALLVSLSYS